MDEKWRLPLWAAAAAKDMEFAATQRSASSFSQEGIAFLGKMKKASPTGGFPYFMLR